MELIGSKVEVKKGEYEGATGIVTAVITIPLSQIWPLVESKNMPDPACSIMLCAVELENGVGVSLPLDCIDFIDA